MWNYATSSLLWGSQDLIRLSITVKTIINGCHRNHFVFSDNPIKLNYGRIALFLRYTQIHTHLRLLYNKDNPIISFPIENLIYHIFNFKHGSRGVTHVAISTRWSVKLWLKMSLQRQSNLHRKVVLMSWSTLVISTMSYQIGIP